MEAGSADGADRLKPLQRQREDEKSRYGDEVSSKAAENLSSTDTKEMNNEIYVNRL